MNEANYQEYFKKLCENIDIQNYIESLIRYYHENVPEYINYNLFLEKQCERIFC
jgi:hypothetical protein